jgi:hypothetical protein
MKKETLSLTLIPWVLCILAAIPAAAGQTEPGLSIDSSTYADHVTLLLRPGEHRIVSEEAGQRLVIDGFSHRMGPGKPMLPAKSFLIGLPPGARTRSVEVKTIEETELPGTYRVIPAPPIVPLPGSPEFERLVQETQREWRRNYAAAYSSDRVYPESIVKLTGSGTLRKYAYASLSLCPFTYHPESGKLIRHDVVEVVIHLDLPAPGSAAALEAMALVPDDLGNERAARYFENYEQIVHLYASPSPPDRPTSYVVVTTDAASDVVASSLFAVWKATLGYDFRIVRTNGPEIAGQPGRDLAERIRNFLRSAYLSWRIEYVLLVGGTDTVPMRYCFPDPEIPGGRCPRTTTTRICPYPRQSPGTRTGMVSPESTDRTRRTSWPRSQWDGYRRTTPAVSPTR